MRIAFLCNGEFALPTIAALERQGVLAGLACSDLAPHLIDPLRQEAGTLGIPFQVVRRGRLEEDLKSWLVASSADAALVQTFPYRIPLAALAIPRLGFFNLHPGALPAYRGPDPVFWQIRRRESSGAMCLHRMTPAFDDGAIVCAEPVPIGPTDTYGVHLSLLSDAAVRCVDQFLSLLAQGESLYASPQAESDAGYQGRPSEADRTIDWATEDAGSIAALTRACNPVYRGAQAWLRGGPAWIVEAREVSFEPLPRLPAGTVIATDAERGLLVLCAQGTVVELTVVATDEGTFSGPRFAALYGIGIGTRFSMPEFVS